MSNWKPAKLGDIAETCLGKMLDKEKNKGEPKPYLANIDVRWGSFDLSKLRTMRFEESETERYGLKNGDLVICEGGEPGRCAIWRDQLPQMMIQKALHRVRANSNFSNEFIFYRLLLAGRRGELDKYFIGSTIKHLTGFTLKQIDFDYPELTEQKKIAAVLSALDAKIELNQRMNVELEGMAKLLYDYWFVQYDFPMSAACAAALGKPHLTGHPYRASGGKMVFNETLKRDIPEGWIDESLEKLGDIVGGSTPSTKVNDYFSVNGTPWISPKDLSDNGDNRFINRGAMGVTEKGIKAASLKMLPAGTVLMSSRAPIGYLAVAKNPVTTNQGFKSIIPDGAFSTDYIYFTLKHFMSLIQANASGTTFKEVSGSTLKAVRIHLPPTELVKKFTEISSKLSSQQSVLEEQNQELTHLRDWLLPMLMNGQVKVS
jgi:type I restriction enzyme S subunit